MSKEKSRKKYEAPKASFVPLMPEERLLSCGKQPAGGGTCTGRPHWS